MPDTYEYRLLEVANVTNDALLKALNALGSEGWFLAGYVDGGPVAGQQYILSRRVQNGEKAEKT